MSPIKIQWGWHNSLGFFSALPSLHGRQVLKLYTTATNEPASTPRRAADLFIWGTGHPGLAAPCSPETIAGVHSLWYDEMRRFMPWRRCALTAEGAESRCWAGAGYFQRTAAYLCGECASVLDAAWHLDRRQLLPPWSTVLTAVQTAGRGQFRRPWFSPPGNIYAALKLPPALPEHDGRMSLRIGWLLAESFESLGVKLQIKWPNDLILNGCKIGGILIEERFGRTMAGVGINVAAAPPENRLRDEAAFPSGSLARFGLFFHPCRLWFTLVEKIRFCYEKTLRSKTDAHIISLVQSRLAFLGREIQVAGSNKLVVQGSLLGLSPEGNLRILKKDGVETVVHSGSIVPLDDRWQGVYA